MSLDLSSSEYTCLSISGVFTIPGLTALQRIPFAASSTAAYLTKADRDVLALPYIALPGKILKFPAIDKVNTKLEG